MVDKDKLEDYWRAINTALERYDLTATSLIEQQMKQVYSRNSWEELNRQRQVSTMKTYWPLALGGPDQWFMSLEEAENEEATTNTIEEETKQMNYSTAVFLINDKVRAVYVTYENEKELAQKTITKPILRKAVISELYDSIPGKIMFKTLDEAIKVDDYVVVPTQTRHGMTVCKVVEVDVNVDFDSPKQVDWIVDKVDNSHYEEVLGQEATMADAVRSAEATKKRNELRAALLADNVERFKALPIAHLQETLPAK